MPAIPHIAGRRSTGQTRAEPPSLLDAPEEPTSQGINLVDELHAIAIALGEGGDPVRRVWWRRRARTRSAWWTLDRAVARPLAELRELCALAGTF